MCVSVFGLVEQVGVGREGDARVAVAELAGDKHDVDASGDNQRRIAVSQAVKAEAVVARDDGSSHRSEEGVGCVM